MILAGKMPKFYIIIVQKIFPEFWGHAPPVSYTYDNYQLKVISRLKTLNKIPVLQPGRHLAYGITQRYLPPDILTEPISWHSIYLPCIDGRLS